MKDLNVEYTYYRISPVAEFPDGERLFLQIEDQPIVIIKIGGEFLATGDICTHDGGEIGDGEITGEEIICPRHGARFNIRTGEAMSLPAVTGIPVYPIRVVEDYLEIGIPK